MPEANPSGVTDKSGLSDNAAGAIAYVTIIPAIIFLVVAPYNRNSYVRFHSWQSIFLFISAMVIDWVLSIVLGLTFAFAPFLHLAFWPLIELAWLAIWIICVVNAVQGKRFKLPVIGQLAEQLANK
ncbi:MAG TPA: hypothetical protein VKB38_01040 [Terracidiphilus sp.]|nr:hypothetical protein [Terracidiphilus sp.]